MKVPGHLTPSEAGELAARAHAGHVVLTHLYPPMEAVDVAGVVGKRFSGKVTVARDMMVIPIGA
jgi:ribonuclease BN (tRNA processing enzyme)